MYGTQSRREKVCGCVAGGARPSHKLTVLGTIDESPQNARSLAERRGALGLRITATPKPHRPRDAQPLWRYRHPHISHPLL